MPPEPPPKASSTTGQPSWIAPVTPVVPHHELLRRIGGGSYGDVWLGRTTVGTWRAVKVVFRDRFTDARPYEREFNGIQKFEPLSRGNEAFIDILQIGRNDAEGYFYYVMELADDAASPQVESSELRVEGEAKSPEKPSTLNFQPSTYVPKTLAKVLLQRGRLPVGECLELGLTLNLGLAHLHRAGLIHRDIKPSNIIFVSGVPKLADIGLVVEMAEARSFVGTEGFIPPEGPNSPQADLYSLGKVLYEAGMGKDRKDFPEPFTQLAESPDATKLLEFNAILLKACAASVRERYQTAEEMNADLALLQSGGSVRRQRKLAGQLRFVQRAGTIAMALAALIALGWWWQAKQTRVVRELAAQKSQLAEEKTRLAEENRNRIVRLDIANGIRLLDEGDPAGALLWFADALPLVTNNPAEESIHRIRIQQTLNQMPRPAQVLAHEHIVKSMAFSRDGKRFATGTEGGWVHLWDSGTGASLMNPLRLEGDEIRQVGFTPDGQRLLASTVLGGGVSSRERINLTSAAVIELTSGQTLFSNVASNLVRAEFIAGGRWLVTVESDYVIRVLDGRDGHQVAALKGHTNSVLAFSSGSDLLASTSADRTIRLWRLPSGEPVGAPIPFDPGEQHPAVLSPDGQRLATKEAIVREGVTNDYIRIWKTDTLASIGKPIESPGVTGSISFHDLAPRRWLLHTFGGRVRIFDADTQAELLPPIQLAKAMVFEAKTADGRRLMAGGAEGVAGMWSLETGEQLAPPFRHGRQILDIALSPDGSQLATMTDEGACVLWKLNLKGQDDIHRFEASFPSDQPPQRLLESFSPDRRRFLIILADGTVRMMDLAGMAEQQMPGGKPAKVEPHQCLFAPDNRQWAIVYVPTTEPGSPVVELWRDEASTFKRQVLTQTAGAETVGIARTSGIMEPWRNERGWLVRQRLRDLAVHNLRFTPDGLRLISVCDDRQIRFWQTDDGSLGNSVKVPEKIEGIDLFPDGRTAFVLDRSVGFALFDIVTGRVLPIAIGSSTVTAFAFDPTGERFATVTEQQWGRVWSTKTGAALSPAVRHDGAVTWVDWSPDGKRIAMAGITPEVRVWDAASGELSLPPLRIGNQPLQTVVWSLDNRFLVARSDENLVRVWDTGTGEAVTPLLKHNGFVRLAHLVANNRLITLSLPNVMRAWDLAETKLRADVVADYAKLVAGRRLNAAGVLLPLKPHELAELSRSLRARAPQLFE